MTSTMRLRVADGLVKADGGLVNIGEDYGGGGPLLLIDEHSVAGSFGPALLAEVFELDRGRLSDFELDLCGVVVSSDD